VVAAMGFSLWLRRLRAARAVSAKRLAVVGRQTV
jgi:hypothetical protein